MTNKAFTLIELLIVFAVIGLLAGIILASVKSFQQRATIAKTLQYGKSVDNLLAADAVGIWNFDEGSGTTVKDTSGWQNNGTINGATFTDDTPHKAAGAGAGKYALSFDGNDSVDCGSGASLNITDAITVSAWIKPNNVVTSNPDTGVVLRGSYTYGMSRDERSGQNTRIWTYINSGSNNLSTTALTLGQWNYVVYTYDKNAASPRWKLYVNGQLKNSRDFTQTISSSGTLLIGANGGQYFNGSVDEVRIFSRALTQTEIRKLYAEGLEGHSNFVSK